MGSNINGQLGIKNPYHALQQTINFPDIVEDLSFQKIVKIKAG
jgi:hypothetical protein